MKQQGGGQGKGTHTPKFVGAGALWRFAAVLPHLTRPLITKKRKVLWGATRTKPVASPLFLGEMLLLDKLE